MNLEDLLEQDFKSAMKAKDADRVSVLRMVKAACINYRIEKKKESLTDADMQEILAKQLKQRRESFESYEKAGRKDLAAKEKKEMEILEAYLPKQLTDEEIKGLAQKAIAACQAKTKSDLGKVMKELIPLVKGKADGKRVNDIVLSFLGS